MLRVRGDDPFSSFLANLADLARGSPDRSYGERGLLGGSCPESGRHPPRWFWPRRDGARPPRRHPKCVGMRRTPRSCERRAWKDQSASRWSQPSIVGRPLRLPCRRAHPPTTASGRSPYSKPLSSSTPGDLLPLSSAPGDFLPLFLSAFPWRLGDFARGQGNAKEVHRTIGSTFLKTAVARPVPRRELNEHPRSPASKTREIVGRTRQSGAISRWLADGYANRRHRPPSPSPASPGRPNGCRTYAERPVDSPAGWWQPSRHSAAVGFGAMPPESAGWSGCLPTGVRWLVREHQPSPCQPRRRSAGAGWAAAWRWRTDWPRGRRSCPGRKR